MSEKTVERRTAEGRVLKANNLKTRVIAVEQRIAHHYTVASFVARLNLSPTTRKMSRTLEI